METIILILCAVIGIGIGLNIILIKYDNRLDEIDEKIKKLEKNNK